MWIAVWMLAGCGPKVTCEAFQDALGGCNGETVEVCSDGEDSWYETSGGERFDCLSSIDCTRAAERLVDYCAEE